MNKEQFLASARLNQATDAHLYMQALDYFFTFVADCWAACFDFYDLASSSMEFKCILIEIK